MKDTQPAPVHLRDYTPPPWLVDRVALTFRLDPAATRVRAQIRFRPNPASMPGRDLRLDGEGLRLITAAINGEAVIVTPDTTGLTLPAAILPDGPFDWEAEVEISPQANTALEGLYISKGMYCTQCEAEGFRRITFYPDRPDVMAPFRVRIESDLPVLLSNGNPVASGPGWAEWEDPHPKPSYLFALVAGDLVATSERFTTSEGRDVALNIWVRKGDEHRTAYAMDALKRSMRWDEDVYGLAYDLDVFNVVAVDDFNMGAMENKGLNIFNSRYVLADPESATDGDFANIERIVAHEYFHNWTGNRITCRDWFQLSLKEGLTVFRDQQFMADMRSAPVQRIGDVLTLRARQFREDAGPLAHPVQPASYVEINNFYTSTVYEKGAELIRMLHLLVRPEGYAKALKLYFQRHDGQAATIEDWMRAFEDATGRDLSQFRRWYAQAGTPRLTVTEDWDGSTFTLRLAQNTPPTPGQPDKAPLMIPVAMGLVGQDGAELLPTQVLELTQAAQDFRFEGLPARPVVSLLRGASAPVIVERRLDAETRAHLLAHDTDPVARWEAGHDLARDILHAMILDGARPGPEYLSALDRLLRDETLDPAFRAFALGLPGQEELAQSLFEAGHTPDPAAIRDARERLMQAMAEALAEPLAATFAAMDTPGPYSPEAAAAGRRALRLRALSLLTRLDGGAKARALFASADNMTEALGAWGALLSVGTGQGETATFYRRWKGDRLVLDKWFAQQILHAAPEGAAEVAGALAQHPDFDPKNPNRFRAVVGALAMNPAGFHHASGAGYRFVADWLIRLDAMNPQAAARQSTAFETWRRYGPERQALIRTELERIRAHPQLSRDMGEMVGRMLDGVG